MPRIKKGLNFLKPLLGLAWAHLGSNQGPSDYESGAGYILIDFRFKIKQSTNYKVSDNEDVLAIIL